MNRPLKKPELLLPGGSPEVMRTAIRYGADAVYLGGEAFGLRAMAKNFTEEEMRDAIHFAHARGKKIYVTANIFARNEDLLPAEHYFESLNELKPDGVLISDPGLFSIARRVLKGIDLHISTQSNNTNYGTFLFWYELGAKRIVTARELSLAEIREIREHIPEDLEIETFVHGAMCISYSGRCLLSSFLAGRDANRGACTHPCRWKYALVEEKRPGQYMPVEEDSRGTYILNSRDLCMIDHIPELVAAGVDSFKIEGRMKTALYAAVTARVYRRAIDDWFSDPALYERNLPEYRKELTKCTYRPYTTGFFFGRPGTDAQIYDSNTYRKGCTYLGTVEKVDDSGRALFHQKNKFSVGDMIEIMKPDGRNIPAEVLSIENEDGIMEESAPHPLEGLRVKLSEEAEPGELLRSKGDGE